MEYYSAIKKNTFESVLMWWMKLEPIIPSEVSQKVKHQYSILMHIYGEGNGNPLQYSCLENPRSREAWWAAVYEVAQSRTRLKRLSSSSSNDDPISETAKETQMYRTVFWALWGKARMG